MNGVITVKGIVGSFAKITEAENAASKAAGVKAVVDEKEIKPATVSG